jgi:hypothetical protein
LTNCAHLLLALLASKNRVPCSEGETFVIFPPELLLHIVYISNILCGQKVIDSRRLQ